MHISDHYKSIRVKKWPKNMRRMATFTHAWNLTFRDLTLTWPLLMTDPWALQYHALALWRPSRENKASFKLPLASADANVKTSNLTFDLSLTWPVTSIFKKHACYREFTSRAIQRRFPLVATWRGSRDLRGGQNGPPPTGCVTKPTPTGRRLK